MYQVLASSAILAPSTSSSLDVASENGFVFLPTNGLSGTGNGSGLVLGSTLFVVLVLSTPTVSSIISPTFCLCLCLW